MSCYAAGFEDRGKGHKSRNAYDFWSKKGKEIDSPVKSPEKNHSPANTLILAYKTSDLIDYKIINV